MVDCHKNNILKRISQEHNKKSNSFEQNEGKSYNSILGIFSSLFSN